MFMIQGDWFADGMQSVDTQSLVDSVIITNKSIIRNIRIPTYEAYKAHWRNDSEIQRHQWAASFLLPLGTIFVLALVILLMVTLCSHLFSSVRNQIISNRITGNLETIRNHRKLNLLLSTAWFSNILNFYANVLFKRCPQTVTAIVAWILGSIIILIALLSINRGPVYV